VTDIAYALGYGSPASFTNIFTRKIGLAPQRYRQMEIGKMRDLNEKGF